MNAKPHEDYCAIGFSGECTCGRFGCWSDISTAPKDGTQFLGGEWVIDYDGKPKFTQRVTWWTDRYGFSGNVINPAYWMPLPQPPAFPPKRPDHVKAVWIVASIEKEDR